MDVDVNNVNIRYLSIGNNKSLHIVVITFVYIAVLATLAVFAYTADTCYRICKRPVRRNRRKGTLNLLDDASV